MAKKKTYKYGQDELDMEKYLHNLGQNVQSYIASLNWTPEQVQEFLNSYNQYMNAFRDQMENGTQRFSTDNFGTINDADGKFSNKDEGDEYYYDDKGKRITLEEYDKLKDSSSKGLFKKKSNHKDSYKTFLGNLQVATYFNKIAQNLRDKLLASSLSNSKFSTDEFGKAWRNRFMPGQDTADWDTFLDDDKFENGVRSRVNRSKKLADFAEDYINNLGDYDYTDSGFKDADDYKGRVNKFIEALRGGDWATIQDTAREAGINSTWLNNLLTNKLHVIDSGESETDDIAKKIEEQGKAEGFSGDKLKEYVQLKMSLLSSALDAQLNLMRQEGEDLEYNNWLASLKGIDDSDVYSYGAGTPWGNWAKQVGSRFYQDYSRLRDNNSRQAYLAHILSNQALSSADLNLQLANVARLSYWASGAGLYRLGSSDEYYLPWTVNGNDHSVYTYDRKSRTIRRRSTLGLDNENMKAALKNQWKVSKHLSGGLIWGSGMGQLTDYAGLEAKQKTAKIKKAREASEVISKKVDLDTGRSEKRKKAGRRRTSEDFDFTDAARFGAMAGDIAGAIAAFVPGVGNTVSTATGLASTAGNFIADATDDSIGWGTTLKNAGFNLAMDAVGMIPVLGAAGKMGKVTRSIIQVAPAAMAFFAAQSNLGPAKQALEKLMSDDKNAKMTVDDWRALAHGFTTLAGAARAGRGLHNYRKFTEKVQTKAPTQFEKGWFIKGHNKPFSGSTARQLRDISLMEKYSLDEDMFRRLATRGIPTPKWLDNFGRVSNPNFRPGVAVLARVPNAVGQVFQNPTYKRSVLAGGAGYGVANGPGTYALRQAAYLSIFAKQGAILRLRKMASGGQIPVFQNGGTPGTYRRLSDLKQFDKNNYTADWDLENLYSGDTSNGLLNAYVSNVAGVDPQRYAPSSVNKREYAQQVQGLDYYKWFDLVLRDNEHVRNAWIKLTDALLPLNSRARFWNAEGKQNTPWAPKNNDVYGRAAQGPYSDIDDYIQHTRYDDVIGARHNVLARRGKRYFYKNVDGQQVWVNPEDINGFDISEKAVNSSWDKDKMIQWDDYELKEKKPESQTSVIPDGNEPLKNKISSKIGDIISKFNPDLDSIGRALYANNENRKMTDLAIKNERTLLRDPMQVQRRQWGNLRAITEGGNRIGLNSHIAHIATGSDQAVLNQKELENTMHNNTIDALRKQADDEMRRTSGEQVWLQEKENLTNRHETSMFNRQSLLQTLYNKGMHELAYRNKRHEIFDTLWKEHQYNKKMNDELLKDIRYQQAKVQGMQNLYNNPEQYGFTPQEAELIKLSLTTQYTDMTPELKKAVDALRYKFQNAQLQIDADARLLSLNNSWLRGLSLMIKNDPVKAVGSDWTPQMFLLPVKKAKGGKLKDGSKIKVAKIRERIKNADRFDKGIWTKRKLSQKDIDRISKSLYGYPKLK